MSATLEELEKQAAEKTKSLETETVHRIRITLTSRDVKALETVCANLKRGAVDKKLKKYEGSLDEAVSAREKEITTL